MWRSTTVDNLDVDIDDVLDGNGNKLKTTLPGIEVETRLVEADTEALEAVHRRQLEWALDHAEEAKESTRL